MNWQERIDNYCAETKYPRSLFIAEDDRVVGSWIMGNNYKSKMKYYGEYPSTYLKRVKALFPDKKKVLHLFSGKVDLSIIPGDTVDINESLNPTFIDDAQTLQNVPLDEYDLILIDPPYSVEDAMHYQTSLISRKRVIDALSRCRSGTHLVILDQVFWMYRRDTWSLEAVIGMIKSTNHRFRVITIFQRF